MTQRRASLSLDLDNLWSYLKTHGDAGWNDFPSYLDIVVPRFLSLLDELSIRITVFVVGQDAALERNRAALRSIADAGHEIGNHSFNHEPWLHLYSETEIVDEIRRAEDAIIAATGHRPRVFRGPGYSLSETVLRVLADRGYACDCSTFPTFVGPLARAYYFLNARLDPDQKARRTALFGRVRDGLRPLRAYRWDLGHTALTEIPVTTMPLIRMPIHYSYLHWLAGFSEHLANGYHRTALAACTATRTEPSLLLHPLDFLGQEDAPQLGFFPAMNQSASAKMHRMRRFLGGLRDRYAVETIGAHAARLCEERIALRKPDLGHGSPGTGTATRRMKAGE